MSLDAHHRPLIDKIRNIARHRATIDIAQFQFISLEGVEAAYGKRWAIERARITDTARDFICKRVHVDDVVIPCDNGFILIFGPGETVDAAVAAHTLAQALNQFFVGTDGMEQARVSVTHDSVLATDIAKFVGSLTDVDVSAAKTGEIVAPRAVEPGAVDVRYRPVWDAKREAVTTYYLEPYYRETGIKVVGYMFEPTPAPRLIDIDELQLKASETALREMMRAGKKAVIGVSVHVSSLTRGDSRTRLFAAMAGFEPELMRYRAIKISGVAPGYPRLYLSEVIGFLAAKLPNVVVGMSALETDFATALDCGPWGLGYAVPADLRFLGDPGFAAKVRKEAALAHSRQKRFHLEGPITPGAAREFVGCGVDYLASPMIWPARQAPEGVFRWSAGRLSDPAG